MNIWGPYHFDIVFAESWFISKTRTKFAEIVVVPKNTFPSRLLRLIPGNSVSLCHESSCSHPFLNGYSSFRKSLAVRSCVCTMSFEGTLADIHLSGPSLFQEATWSDLVFSRVLCFFGKSTSTLPFFKSIKLICDTCWSHPFDEWPFSYYKGALAVTHSFSFTVFAEQEL